MKNKVIIASVLSGIASYLTGFVTYVLLFGEFFKNNMNYGELAKNPPEQWAIFVSNIVLGFFFIIIFDRWASISTFKSGLIAGAWMGLLLGVAINVMNFGLNSAETMQAHIVGAILWGIIAAVGGGVGGWVLGYGNKSSE